MNKTGITSLIELVITSKTCLKSEFKTPSKPIYFETLFRPDKMLKYENTFESA